MAQKHVSAQEHASGFSKRMRTVALVVVALAFVMDLLDSTIVNVAIPSIQTNLNASYAAIQWLVAGYALSFALLLVSGGRMGDVFGYKKLFMIGVGGFTVASLLSGLAWNPASLIVFRLLQGSMAALMVPQVMSIMQVMYKPNERGAINGLFGALGGLAASLGPVIGGLLIKANWWGLDWRPIFLINVPIGIFGLIAGARYLPNGKSPHPLKLDIYGTFILVLAMGLLVFPLIQGRELDWPAWSFAMMAASVPAFAWFAIWQKKRERLDGSSLILPSLFKKRSFGVGLLVNLVFEAAMIGYFLTFSLLLQIGLGFSPIHAALTGLPVAVGIAMTMAILGEKVIPKMGRYALTIGALTMALGLGITTWVLQHLQLDVNSWELIPGLLVVGIGMGLTFSSLFAAVLNDVDASHAGSASGTLNALQQVGGAIGVAVIGVVFFGQINTAAATSFDAVSPKLKSELTAQHVPAPAQEQIVSQVKKCFVDRSREKDATVLPASCKQGESQALLSKPLFDSIATTAKEANARNFNTAFRWSVIVEVAILVVVFLISFLLPKHFRPEAYEEVA